MRERLTFMLKVRIGVVNLKELLVPGYRGGWRLHPQIWQIMGCNDRRVLVQATESPNRQFLSVAGTMALWVDKYRPHELSKLTYHTEQANHLASIIKVSACKMLEILEVCTNHKVEGTFYRDLPLGAQQQQYFSPQYLSCVRGSMLPCTVSTPGMKSEQSDPQGTQLPMEVRSLELIWTSSTKVEDRRRVAKREIHHRCSWEPVFSKKGLAVSAASTASGNGGAFGENMSAKTRPFYGGRVALHALEEIGGRARRGNSFMACSMDQNGALCSTKNVAYRDITSAGLDEF
uniref:Uncharacterized protein n=2 Tax=Parascaris univalens TaxID=6257 RepID=A0A915CGL4_PARUN